MKTLKYNLSMLLIMSIVLLSSCKDDKDTVDEKPTITDVAISEITEKTVKGTFKITAAEKVQKAGLMYDTNYSLAEDAREVSTTVIGDGNVSFSISALEGNTYYYYKAYVVTKKGDSIFSTIYGFRTGLPPLYVSPTKIEAAFFADTFQFQVTTNLSWSISSNQSWCTVKPESGEVSNEITVSLSENMTGAARSAILTVRAGNFSEQVTVEQAFPELTHIEPQMVFVQGGTFTMGCTWELASDCFDDERPAHEVTVSDFNIGKYEVTQAQWRTVMKSNPSYFTGDSLPVERVSWNEVKLYISRLNSLTGKQYRLPTEAEWEYAARGGNKGKGSKYSGSNEVDSVAWYWSNIPSQTRGDEGYGTQPVGTKSPNELGVYDMSGNVLEWCSDWYGAYSSDAQTNPTGPLSGIYRTCRGGSWSSSARGTGVSYRGFISPDISHNYLGFRLVLSN